MVYYPPLYGHKGREDQGLKYKTGKLLMLPITLINYGTDMINFRTCVTHLIPSPHAVLLSISIHHTNLLSQLVFFIENLSKEIIFSYSNKYEKCV